MRPGDIPTEPPTPLLRHAHPGGSFHLETPIGKHRTLLIDGDILFYRAAAVSQGSIDWGEGVQSSWGDEDGAIRRFEEALSDTIRTGKASDYFVCLSDHAVNFRKELGPHIYKSNRKAVTKPVLLQFLEDYTVEHHPILSFPRLEADDVIGIHATSGEHVNPVIVSADKDLKQIPGWHLQKGKPVRITPEDGALWFHTQVLIGDPTDGYKGCPGIGPIAAAKILDCPPEERWQRIVETYERKGLTEDDALLQARFAYILQHGDYRPSDHKIKLWKPPS